MVAVSQAIRPRKQRPGKWMDSVCCVGAFRQASGQALSPVKEEQEEADEDHHW